MLDFNDNVPQWLRRLVRREVKRLRVDWRLTVVCAEEAATEGRAGMMLMQPEYKVATVIFAASLCNDAEALHTTRHELLHTKFAPLVHYVETALPAKMPGRRIILKHLDNLVETMIEELLRIL